MIIVLQLGSGSQGNCIWFSEGYLVVLYKLEMETMKFLPKELPVMLIIKMCVLII